LSNDIKIPITAINNHNGVINNEIRLVMVIEGNTGLPIYYRYVSGNFVDVSILSNIINELKEYNVRVNRAILDASYYSKDNLIELYNNNIPFITIMVDSVIDHKKLINEHGASVKATENYVNYNNRHMYIKKIPVSIFDGKINAFAYLCCDLIKERYDEDFYLTKQIESTKKDLLKDATKKFGKFIILSTVDLNTYEILPYYYISQDIEQIFDYLKNEIDILPTTVHSESAFRGHLLICFMALTVYKYLNIIFNRNKLNLKDSLISLGRYYCKVYEKRIVPDVLTNSITDILKSLKISVPKIISKTDVKVFK
jgi:transposase